MGLFELSLFDWDLSATFFFFLTDSCTRCNAYRLNWRSNNMDERLNLCQQIDFQMNGCRIDPGDEMDIGRIINLRNALLIEVQP